MKGGGTLLLALVVIIVLVIGAGLGMYRLGSSSAKAEINQTNMEAQDEADQASSAFSRCVNDGWVFDFATGKCGGR